MIMRCKRCACRMTLGKIVMPLRLIDLADSR